MDRAGFPTRVFQECSIDLVRILRAPWVPLFTARITVDTNEGMYDVDMECRTASGAVFGRPPQPPKGLVRTRTVVRRSVTRV